MALRHRVTRAGLVLTLTGIAGAALAQPLQLGETPCARPPVLHCPDQGCTADTFTKLLKFERILKTLSVMYLAVLLPVGLLRRTFGGNPSCALCDNRATGTHGRRASAPVADAPVLR